MRKFFVMLLTLTLAASLLSGCTFLLELGTPPTLPKLELDASTLTAQVEYVNGRTCRVHVLEGDSHFDAATEKREADVLYVTYSSLSGNKSVGVGDTVVVDYAYSADVSERDGKPHITVRVLQVGQ